MTPIRPKSYNPPAALASNQPVVVPNPITSPQNTNFPAAVNFGKPNPGNVPTVGQGPAGNNAEQFLNPPLQPELVMATIGDPGNQRYGGFFMEDYDPDWSDNELRVQLVEQMRRGDARVAQLLKAVKAPMLACDFDIECASDDPKDQKIVDFIKQNLFEMPDRSWKDFFRQSLTDIDFGYSVFEQCYEMRNGKIMLKDLAPRIQHSILRFRISSGARGIVQVLRTDEAPNYYVEIPIRKCLIFTNDMEGNDLTGIPLLRYCFKHWYIKNNLYQIAGISAERFGVGLPVMTLPEGSGPQDLAAATSIVQNLRANEQSGIVLPNDKWKLEIIVPNGRSTVGADIKNQIDHHDLMILHAGICAFLNLGTTDTGSFALASDARGFFLTYIQDRMTYRCEQIDKQVIQPLLDMNGMKPSKPIKLKFTKLGDKDKTGMSTWLAALQQAGLLKVDSKLMDWTAKNFGLPELTEDDKDMLDIQEIEGQIPGMPQEQQPEEKPQEEQKDIPVTK